MTGTLDREIISTRQEKLAVCQLNIDGYSNFFDKKIMILSIINLHHYFTDRLLEKLARIEPKRVVTTLAHHLVEVWLREAYRRTRKDGAVGVAGMTAGLYEADLEANLASLLERKSGWYRAPAVRRVHIPKPGKAKKRRPIGIPTLEDNVLQRAVLMVLEPVFEETFWTAGTASGRGAVPPRRRTRYWDHLRSFLDQRVREGERSFGLLGFTPYWGRSRKVHWVVHRKTAKDRFTRALREVRSRVSSTSSLAGGGPTSGITPQAPGPLCLLRHHGQCASARPVFSMKFGVCGASGLIAARGMLG